MSTEKVIVVAVEDISTAGVVGAAAAHVAMDRSATHLVLLHVLDDHVFAGGLAGLTPTPTPVVETAEEGKCILDLAEAALRAEYDALNVPGPSIALELGEGRPAPSIAQVAADAGAEIIVAGARRPHAFGRLTHPDVLASLRRNTEVPVHVVALQAETPQPQDVETA